jgi:hypothetical protein
MDRRLSAQSHDDDAVELEGGMGAATSGAIAWAVEVAAPPPAAQTASMDVVHASSAAWRGVAVACCASTLRPLR